MPRILLAALALACVCSPVMAAECAPAPSTVSGWIWYLGFTVITMILLGVMIARDYRRAERERRMWSDYLRCWPACMACGLAMILLLGAGPAIAAEVATVGGTSVDLPWGAWVAAAMPSVASVAVTILGGIASAALAKFAPWATLFISQKRIEATIQTGLDYGINAVQGATKDAKLTVPVGSQVLAVALQRIIDSTPAKIIDAVGGPAEIAKRLFRAMHLDENSSAAQVLEPILARLPATAR